MRRFPDPNRRYLWTANATVHSGARLRHQQVNAVDRIRTELFCTEGGGRVDKRFLLLSDVAEVLNISAAQAYALVRSGELPAIKVGGRGQWRVERDQLESYIQRAYTQTREFVEAHPFGRGDDTADEAG